MTRDEIGDQATVTAQQDTNVSQDVMTSLDMSLELRRIQQYVNEYMRVAAAHPLPAELAPTIDVLMHHHGKS